VANKESISRTFIVATLLCLVCGIFVATAAVQLKPIQQANAVMNLQRNVLLAADRYDPTASVADQWGTVDERYVDLETGRFVSEPAEGYSLDKILKDAAQYTVIDRSEDAAGIGRRENIVKVYVFNDNDGIERIVLPLRGKGLWSTMWGFMALENDFNTVAGFTFYEHGETPGLGGEVDNPRWKAQWPGKVVYDVNGDVQLTVTKAGQASASSDDQIDGLSGATLTTNGIDGTVQYWMGEHGYRTFLENLKAGDA